MPDLTGTPSDVIHYLANPARFARLANRILPWSWAVALVLVAWGVYLGLWASPADYQQGETVRIMYVHVPAAWVAMLSYTVLAGAGAAGLVWRHPLAFLAARAAAPIGACFTFLALATGSLWGQPTWGTWWVWDARLTSVLVLFFVYVGHMALSNAFEDINRGDRAAAILALVGVVNLPIIKWSVDWWNTLHQPASVMKLGAPSIHPDLLTPLLIMGLAYVAMFVSLLLLRLRGEVAARRLRVMAANHAAGQDVGPAPRTGEAP